MATLGHERTNALPVADGLLLEQFINDGNHDAFATLMDRHGPYVLSVCRHVTRHAQDAEDVFQGCFLELVRNASMIRQRGSVAGWLQTVAVRLGRKVQARTAQRRQKEIDHAQPGAGTPPDDISWREACQILEEEIAQLPDELRLPIILCLFQGKTQEEAADDLGINPRTLKDRLRRGRELLRNRLVRRGVTLAVLGTLLSSSNLEAAVPAVLAKATLQGATSAAAPLGLAGSGVAGWVAVATALLGTVLTASGAYLAWDELASPPPAEVRLAKVDVRPGPRPIHRTFRAKQFDTSLFDWSRRDAKKYVRFEEEGLRLTLPAENGPADAVGIKLRYPVRGDVEVEATLDVLPVERPAEGWAAGVTLYLFMDSAERDGLWMGKMIGQVQGPSFSFGQRIKAGKDRANKFLAVRPAEHETGITRLRVVRKGARFDLFAAEGLDGAYRHLHSEEISGANMTIVRIAVDPLWLPNVPMDVRLLDFTITAEEIVGYEPSR